MAAPSGYQPVLPAASCGGTFAYWLVDAASNPVYNRTEDADYSHANAFNIGGFSPVGDGTWTRSDTPTGSGTIAANTAVGDFATEDNTSIVEATHTIYGMTAEPNQLRTITIVDTGGFEHQTFACLLYTSDAADE